MGIKHFLRYLTGKRHADREAIRGISNAISKQKSANDRHEFLSMIEGMICAGELALAVHSLRTEYDENECNDIEIDNKLKNLEKLFHEEMDKLLKG